MTTKEEALYMMGNAQVDGDEVVMSLEDHDAVEEYIRDSHPYSIIKELQATRDKIQRQLELSEKARQSLRESLRAIAPAYRDEFDARFDDTDEVATGLARIDRIEQRYTDSERIWQAITAVIPGDDDLSQARRRTAVLIALYGPHAGVIAHRAATIGKATTPPQQRKGDYTYSDSQVSESLADITGLDVPEHVAAELMAVFTEFDHHVEITFEQRNLITSLVAGWMYPTPTTPPQAEKPDKILREDGVEYPMFDDGIPVGDPNFEDGRRFNEAIAAHPAPLHTIPKEFRDFEPDINYEGEAEEAELRALMEEEGDE